MRREFSKGTLKAFLERYPHLNEDQANLALTHGEVIKEDVKSDFGLSYIDPIIVSRAYRLHLKKDLAEIFFIDEITDLLVSPNDEYVYREIP